MTGGPAAGRQPSTDGNQCQATDRYAACLAPGARACTPGAGRCEGLQPVGCRYVAGLELEELLPPCPAGQRCGLQDGVATCLDE